MTAITFKTGPANAREIIAALLPLSPWYSKTALADLLSRTDKVGIQVTVDRIRKRRSSAQNNFYWMGIGILAKALGMSPDECHLAVLCEHHGSTEVSIGSRTHHVPKGRSHDLDTVAMGELIETLFRVSAFAGVTLPDPQQMESA
jgi:hypothetical protein